MGIQIWNSTRCDYGYHERKQRGYENRRYYIKCRDVEFRFKGKEIMLRDGSKTKVIQGSTSGTERTRKRLLKQQTKRKLKQSSRKEHQHESRNH